MAKKGVRSCPICGCEVKADNLTRHMNKAHPGDQDHKVPTSKMSKKKSARREAAKQARKKEFRNRAMGATAFLAVVVVLSLLVLHFWDNIIPPKEEKIAHIQVNSEDGAIAGEIVIELYTEECPITTNNFIKLADEGFFNSLLFHRVIWDFMIQGGDPNGDGTGGPGYKINDELAADHGFTHSRGAVSMANANNPDNNVWNTGGSQFFIVQGATRSDLDTRHSIFGMVTSGLDLVDKIAALDKDTNKQTDSNNKPYVPVHMTKVWIETAKTSSAPINLFMGARTMDSEPADVA